MNNYSQVVDNQTKETIVVLRFHKGAGNFPSTLLDSTIIKSNNRGVIFLSGGLGGFGSNSNCKLDIVDSLAVYIKDKPSVKIVKDLNNTDYWIHSRSGNSRKGYNSQCMAVTNNSDIIPK
ncbi:MAG: hypothetical protein ABS67_00105 [Niabella sp. SCN 42-15]|nr:MAG: hypothetical protein ABS67_00105 [Niabella sp. SCN 42-15]